MTQATSLNGKPVQLTPYAILAAILFNLNKQEPVSVVPDDGSADPVEVLSDVIGIEAEGDAIVCVIPADKVMHFANHTYDCQVLGKDGHLFVTFERRKDGGGLLTADGKRAISAGAVVPRLMKRILEGA